MKLIAAMSGGVDSAVAAARAVEAGHEVIGVHLALAYPSWGAKIQFDYILSDTLQPDQFEALPAVVTGMSDHLPLQIEIPTEPQRMKSKK